MYILIILLVGTILFIIFGQYLFTAEFALEKSEVVLSLDISSFLKIYRLIFTVKNSSKNLNFIFLGKTFSMDGFLKKKLVKRKDHGNSLKKIFTFNKNRKFKKIIKTEEIELIKGLVAAAKLKKSKVKLIFGSSDPFITGAVCACLYPCMIICDFIDFEPDFQEEQFKLFGSIVLRIFLYKIIILFLQIRYKEK